MHFSLFFPTLCSTRRLPGPKEVWFLALGVVWSSFNEDFEISCFVTEKALIIFRFNGLEIKYLSIDLELLVCSKGEAFIRNMTFKGLWLLSLWTFHRWGNCNQGLLCDSSLWVSFRSCSSCRSWACSTTSPRWPSAVCQTKPYRRHSTSCCSRKFHNRPGDNLKTID